MWISSVDFIVHKFLGENHQSTDAPNPIIETHHNVNVDEINEKLNKLENSLEREKNHGKTLQELRKELPYEQLNFSDLKKLSEALEAADEEVESVARQLMESRTEFPYQTIGSALPPLRVRENNLFDSNEGASGSHE
ncbi:uncharacterized protein LOC125863852 [Solanum stenotomum]|uniref:uncharacterized protein LOC125863852 n=1 Tax=Solanum stenotomum TaxID=172797 RepID=UPI0020CFFF2B|nr:uncharacterized protein LOC125863852 [Solanum stenotomum]